MSRLALGATAAAAVLVLSAVPVAGDPWGNGGSITDDGLLARARDQMRTLNAGYNGNPAPTCDDEHDYLPDDGNDEVEHDGWLRWEPDFENDPTPPRDGPSIEWYRLVCHIPGRPWPPGDPLGAAWMRFDAVTPENLARVAVDDMLAAIPEHSIGVNPEPEAMVAIDTWLWVDGVSREPVVATASVPGVEVVATAEPGGVHFDFGDGTSLECDGPGSEWSQGATSDCTHRFDVAGHYTITATIIWSGSYTINGGPPVPLDTVVTRSATFDLAVNEAQAVNRPSR